MSVSAHELAKLLAYALQQELRAVEADGDFAGWDWEWPDSDAEPRSFGVVDKLGELRFEVQVIEW